MSEQQTIILCSVALGVVLLFVLVLLARCFLLAPSRRRPSSLEELKHVKFAHRGLHGEGRAENSMSAFAAAKAAGFGIELDVRLCRDGDLVVFHDPTLDRVAGVEGRVLDMTKEQLRALSLSDTGEGVPSFKEVLELIDGAVPLLIEIKVEESPAAVTERLLLELEGYNGPYVVESFHPLALRILKKQKPDIVRGILSTRFSQKEEYRGKLLYTLLEKLYLNFLFRPDFIAYEHTGHSVKNLRMIRKRYKTPLFAWTVRSREDEDTAVGVGFDTVIFEGYIPEKRTN